MSDYISPVQQELHKRQQERFSKTEAGRPWWSGTSPSGKVYEVFGAKKGFTNRHAVAVVKEQLPSVRGWAERELGRYYGFSPTTLMEDHSEEEMSRHVLGDLQKTEPNEDESFLLQVAQAMVDTFNVMVLDEF